MSDRERPDSPDEYIIGGATSGVPARTPDPRSTISSDWEQDGDFDDAVDDDGYGVIGGDGELDPYDEYYDDYYEAEPARQPLFYAFIGLAVALGGVLVFLLFRLVSGGDDGPAPTPEADFNVSIDSPLTDERVNVGTDITARVRANATEPIRTLELLLGGRKVDEEQFATAPTDGIYSASMVFRVDKPGTYEIVARAVSESGASHESSTVRVIAVERIDTKPSRITGQVISTVNTRRGPGDQFTQVRTLNAGEVVTIIGRTRDGQWLLLEDETWIRRAAVQPSDSLDLVDVRQPTPTLAPISSPTPAPSVSTSPSTSPSPSADAPDLSPTNAAFENGGAVLRVTIANLSSKAYEGPLVVRVSGVGNTVLEQVFSVKLNPNGNQQVSFTLAQPHKDSATAQVTVDSGGQVKETNEDNNAASFVLAAPVSKPQILISDASIIKSSTVRVTITNVGNDMPASNVVVTVALGGVVNTASRAGLALAFGESQAFNVTRPEGSGQATITVTVGGQQLATGTVEIPGGSATPTTPTASTTPTTTATP